MHPALRTVPDEARSRPVAVTGRPLICLLGGDNDGNTTETLRLQRLLQLGISQNYATLIAGMAWGEVRHG